MEPEFDWSEMEAVFAASGTVGQDMAEVDWGATPLGRPESWPQSLKTVVRVLLTSRFSMWMAWGPALTFFANETYRRDTLGTKYPWALGKPASEVWAEIWDDIGPRIGTVMSTGVASWDQSLLLFLERSGYREETYHTFSYSPLTDDAGHIAGMLCVVSEDTDRVIAERRMTFLGDLGAELTSARTEEEVCRTAEQRLSSALHTLPFSAIYLFEGDGLRAQLACVAGARIGDPVAPAIIEDEEPDPAWPVAEVAGGHTALVEGLSEKFEEVPIGAWVDPPMSALVVPLMAQTHERPYGFLVTALNPYRPFDRDYEGFVALVASQLAASIANARAYEAERRRAETLAELDRAKTAFFTNVSHEFRTPLTLLLGPAEDALADSTTPLPPAQRRRVELVHQNGQRLLKLVNTLLDFSRLESGKVTARYEPVDLPSYTAQLAAMFRGATERAGLRLEIDCEPMKEPVFVDREMWAKIVSNLLSNALKFTFAGGINLRLTASADQGAVELEVTDTGIGIDTSDQAHLFERFHRVVGARSRTYEGSGIGLALVAELAEMHGGEVAATSTPGVGSTFMVRIPLGRSHLDEAQLTLDPAGDARSAEKLASDYVDEAMRWLDAIDPIVRETTINTAPGPDASAPRVLVVDDNADMRLYVSSLLESTYQVAVADDGAIALDMARRQVPDLVLTDVMMPNLDGFGLLKALRADPLTSHVPVVILSARAGEEAAVEGLDAGADDYLAKPFSARELTARVRSNLELERARREGGKDRALLAEVRRSREMLDQAESMARVGSWELDLGTGEVSGSEQLVRMLQLTQDELREIRLDEFLPRYVHPDDRAGIEATLAAVTEGFPISYECRLVNTDVGELVCDVRGEAVRDETGKVVRLRGSVQDVTAQRKAERAVAAAELAQQSAKQEHRIAEDLQRSLAPPVSFSSDYLHVATYYQAGVQGTQVGGDWYDVVELGAGRTALVIGDVMGRGVRAAAVMGQLRAAVRAYARLDIPPADLLELMDSTVRDLEGGQIVTCVFAIYDPADQTLTYSNAGHLPPLVACPGEEPHRLARALGPPLGAGPAPLGQETVNLTAGTTLVLYTDGLVERRGSELDFGIDAVAGLMAGATRPPGALTTTLVTELCPNGADDDVSILVAQVPADSSVWASMVIDIPPETHAVSVVRGRITQTLREWEVSPATTGDVVLVASELVTNAIIHGRPPLQMRMHRTQRDILIEVIDASSGRPKRLSSTPDDEHGRGLQIVETLASRWGTRLTEDGKSIWCITPIR